MKFAALVLVMVCAQSWADMPNPEKLHEMMDKKIEDAMKRKYGANFGGSEDNTCAKACITAPPQGFGKFIFKFKDPKAENIKEIYDQEMLTKVCTYTNKTAGCIRACPDTQRRQFMKEIFAPIKYMCEDTKFVEFAPCYKETFEIMQPICSADDKCGAKKTDLFAKYQAYKTAEPKTKEVIEAMVGSFCTLVDCGIDCGNDKRKEKCGEEANTVLRGFYKKLVESSKDTRYFSPREFVIDIPASCDHIGH